MSHKPWHIDGAKPWEPGGFDPRNPPISLGLLYGGEVEDEVPYGHSPHHYNDPYGLLRAEAQGPQDPQRPLAPGSRGVNYNEMPGGVIPGLLGGLTQGPYEDIKNLLGRGKDFARENPVEAAKIGGEFAVDMSPGVGDVKALYDMGRFAEEGRYGMSAISGLSAMPWFLGLPVGADMIRARANAVDAMRAQTKLADAVADATRVADDVVDFKKIGSGELKPNADGTYVGGPRSGIGRIDTPEKLAEMREGYLDNIMGGLEDRGFYKNTSKWLDDDLSPKTSKEAFADVLGLTSQGASVAANLQFAIQDLVRRAIGRPSMGGRYRNPNDQKMINEWLGGSGESFEYGAKRTPFGQQVASGKGDVSVNDIWQGRAFGYRHEPTKAFPDGKVWSEGFSETEHAFMQGQMDDIVKFLNDNKVGGFTDWDHSTAQAAAWGGIKRKSGENVVDYSHLASQHSAYTQSQGSDWVNPGTGRDRLLEDTGILQRESRESFGLLGDPTRTNKPLIGHRQGRIQGAGEELLNIVEGSRAYVDGEKTGLWHKLIPNASAGEQTSMRLTLGDGEFSPSQVTELNDVLLKRFGKGKEGPRMTAIHTGDGVTLLDTGMEIDGSALLKVMKKEGLLDEIDAIVPGADVFRMKADGGYVSFEDVWDNTPGTGKVTGKFLEIIFKNPTLKIKLEETLREQAARNMKRDATQGGLVRADLQNARKILAEEGLDGLKKAFENGAFVPTVALLGGLGLARQMGLQAEGSAQPGT